jgi:hypothetical protein
MMRRCRSDRSGRLHWPAERATPVRERRRRVLLAVPRAAWNRARLDFVARRDEGGPAADLDPNATGRSRLADQAAVS